MLECQIVKPTACSIKYVGYSLRLWTPKAIDKDAKNTNVSHSVHLSLFFKKHNSCFLQARLSGQSVTKTFDVFGIYPDRIESLSNPSCTELENTYLAISTDCIVTIRSDHVSNGQVIDIFVSQLFRFSIFNEPPNFFEKYFFVSHLGLFLDVAHGEEERKAFT